MEHDFSATEVAKLVAENYQLRERLDLASDRAHSHALDAVENRGADQARIRLELELAATQRELDRLRSIPELRVGQRLRNLGRRSEANRVPAPEGPTDSAGEQSTPPVVIVVRDRLACLDQLVTWFEAQGVDEIHLVDNASTYPPLVNYLEHTPHHVWRVGANLGHRSPWLIGLIAELCVRGPFVVTDPDVLPDPFCPSDVFDRLQNLLDRYPDVDKVGLGLRIDDLPLEFARREEVREWEGRHWADEIEPGVFRAAVDTTFALYRPATSHNLTRALRTGPPYVARHLPWYSDSDHLSAEEEFYREHLDRSMTSWDRVDVPLYIRAGQPTPHIEKATE